MSKKANFRPKKFCLGMGGKPTKNDRGRKGKHSTSNQGSNSVYKEEDANGQSGVLYPFGVPYLLQIRQADYVWGTSQLATINGVSHCFLFVLLAFSP
jgi:hypothetical protein